MCYNNHMDKKINKKQIINTNDIKYHIFDPTKNITILVDSDIDITEQPKIAKLLMENVTNAEQVGFVKFDTNGNVKLRMAGGEFCGNATICAGVYAVLKENNNSTNHIKKVYVDALKNQIDVEIKYIDKYTYMGIANMPHAKGINKIELSNNETYEIVELDGISHIIIDIEKYKENIIFDIDNNDFKKYFEEKIKTLSDYFNIDSLGIIFYDKNNNSITPLVYIKTADTLYWENSCASGSIATYEYLKYKNELPNINTNTDTNKKTGLKIYQPCKEYLEIYEIENKLYLSEKVKIIS